MKSQQVNLTEAFDKNRDRNRIKGGEESRHASVEIHNGSKRLSSNS